MLCTRLYRKEVVLREGSVLKIRGHPRDLVQVEAVSTKYLNILVRRKKRFLNILYNNY